MNIYFDFDGTLIDVRDKYYAIYNAFVSTHGGVGLDQQKFWNLKKVKDGDADILHLSGLGRLSRQCFRDYIKDQVETIPYLEKDTLFPGVADLLENLSRDHSCKIVTARRNNINFQAQVDWLKIRPFVSELIVADRSDSKSATMTDKTRALRGQVVDNGNLFVGDTEEDILTGQQMSMTTFAVVSGVRHRQYLESLKPDHILNSVTDLPPLLPVASRGKTRTGREFRLIHLCKNTIIISIIEKSFKIYSQILVFI